MTKMEIEEWVRRYYKVPSDKIMRNGQVLKNKHSDEYQRLLWRAEESGDMTELKDFMVMNFHIKKGHGKVRPFPIKTKVN